jgi:hypothetical protein
MRKVIFARKKCIKCGKVIAIAYQINTGHEYAYETENTEDRFIGKWGNARDLCKKCVR